MDIVDRLPLYSLIASFVLYPIAAALVLRLSPARLKMMLFALLNVSGLAFLCLLSGAKDIRASRVIPYSGTAFLFFLLYLSLVLIHYGLLRFSKNKEGGWTLLVFFWPLALLAYIKYASDVLNPFQAVLTPIGLTRFGAFFIGISYLSFRLVHLVQEVRNDVVEMPTVWEYLSFAFFVPTLSIGPISPYSLFVRSVRMPDRSRTPVGQSLLRIVVGFTKYMFIGSLIGQLTYAALLRDGHPHRIIDLIVAIPAYAVYLYCNFSGFCDMVVGVSGLLSIEIAENFDQPFVSRNFQELWTRWHITFSTWIRDLLFTPLSKAMIRRVGSRHAPHAIAAAILVSFLAVGVWHGKGFTFLFFGFLQGLGLVCVHYYTVLLKKRLSREAFASYRKNKLILVLGRGLTFAYFAMTLFFLANTWEDIQVIRKAFM